METHHDKNGPWQQSSFQQQWGLVGALLDHFDIPRSAVIYKDGKAIINLPDFLVTVDKYGHAEEFANHGDWERFARGGE